MLLGAILLAAAGPVLHFDLSPGKPQPGCTRVPPGKTYESGGFGYEPASRGHEFLFSAAVPEGNYKVTVRVGGRATIKAEQRRLMVRDIVTRPGRYVTVSFVVNVRTPAITPPPMNAPGGDRVRLNDRETGSYTWDDKLTLEFLGDPQVASIDIEPIDVPTIYLVGDSTVTDQPGEPNASWGQMLPALFEPDIVVANHAESGETMKSFLTALRFDKVLDRMKAGDFLFLQFGHNDQKATWPQTYVDPLLTYPAYLRAYIAEARRRGATPVLVTPPERRSWDGTHIRHSLLEYADAMRKVAREDDVLLLDLQTQSIALYEAFGPDRALLLFGGTNGRDPTHHDNAGAWLLARAVAAQAGARLPTLSRYLRPEARAFDPVHPDAKEIEISPSIVRATVRPAGS